MSRASSTGKRNPFSDQTNWRELMQDSRIKFDDEAKQIYLREIAEHGRKGDACLAAGITDQTVRKHLDIDPEFATAADVATEAYRDKFVKHAMKLATKGVTSKTYDGKTGKLTSKTIRYPIPLIQMELKRVDHSYRENAQSAEEAGGGVLVAPASMSPTEWIEEQEKANEAKDAPSTDS